MSRKKFEDLIYGSRNVGGYQFKCWLAKSLKDEDMRQYTSICLNTFKSFYATNFSRDGREIFVYNWDFDQLAKRWNSPELKKQLGVADVTMNEIRPYLVKFYIVCRNNGLLPKTLRVPKKHNRFHIKNTSQLPPSLFYCYITHLRQVWEEPHFVYNVVTLVSKYKLNIWTAYVVATHLSIYNSNHHVLSISAYGGAGGSAKIGLMFNLRDYFTAPRKKDTRQMKSMGSASWGIHGYLRGGLERAVPVKEILENPEKFNKLLEMPKDEAMTEFLKNVKFGVLYNDLTNLGYKPTRDYNEPWWLHIRVNSPKEVEDIVGTVKKAIEGYIYKEGYGANLIIKVKDAHLDVSAVKKKQAFDKASRMDMSHFIEV